MPVLLPYTQQIHDPKTVDYQLAQMLNEPYTGMKVDIGFHDEENWIEYDRDAIRKAKLASGPHFWNGVDGSAFVTLVFDVKVHTEREAKPRVALTF